MITAIIHIKIATKTMITTIKTPLITITTTIITNIVIIITTITNGNLPKMMLSEYSISMTHFLILTTF